MVSEKIRREWMSMIAMIEVRDRRMDVHDLVRRGNRREKSQRKASMTMDVHDRA
jgi:hypothetical protein